MPSDDSRYHYQADALDVIRYAGPWDLMIAFPPCTHLAVSGAHRFKFKQDEQRESLAFVRALMDAPIERIAIENPVGVISSRIRKPDQIIQPYQFGHDASKRTCLWLKGLPTLTATSHVAPRIVDGLPRWANQTDSGQNRETPHPDRWKRRSATYHGIADAMAAQWSTDRPSDRPSDRFENRPSDRPSNNFDLFEESR